MVVLVLDYAFICLLSLLSVTVLQSQRQGLTVLGGRCMVYARKTLALYRV